MHKLNGFHTAIINNVTEYHLYIKGEQVDMVGMYGIYPKRMTEGQRERITNVLRRFTDADYAHKMLYIMCEEWLTDRYPVINCELPKELSRGYTYVNL